MKRKESGFTAVELIAVVAIIAILVGLLIPAITMVRNIARETKQKGQFAAIDLALTAFKSDYGDYPPSDCGPGGTGNYGGAQKLSEALVGWDLMGFHPKSAWRADGLDSNGGEWTYDPGRVRGDNSFDERKGPYLELATANAFRLGDISPVKPGLFRNWGTYLAPDTFVLCDVFGIRRISMITGAPESVTVKAGTPILYYKANPSGKTMDVRAIFRGAIPIYNQLDNLSLILLGRLTSNGTSGRPHRLMTNDGISGQDGLFFYDPRYKIIDPKVTTRPWPYRPDSYILISAGADGEYGTGDDITNF